MDAETGLFSPIAMNNKGVGLLDGGKHKDAIVCFKQASKMMSVIILQQQRVAGKEKDTKEVDPGSSPEGIRLDQIQQNLPHKRAESTGPKSLKRLSRGTLGMPIHIQTYKDESDYTMLDSAYVSGKILFNLGLSLNLIAMKKHKAEDQDSILYFDKALNAYKRCCEIQHSILRSATIIDEFIVLALHNIVYIYDLLSDHEHRSKIRRDLEEALRLLCIGDRQYEKFFENLSHNPSITSTPTVLLSI